VRESGEGYGPGRQRLEAGGRGRTAPRCTALTCARLDRGHEGADRWGRYSAGRRGSKHV
jgi:hypothetical protein